MSGELAFSDVFIIVFITFLTGIILGPIVKKIAYHVGALDEPNERKIHKKPMPRLGGLIIYFAFLFGVMIFAEMSPILNAVLIGSFIIIILGICDDIKPVKARYKFLVQLIAATIVVFYGNISVDNVTFFGIKLIFGDWGYLFAIIFITTIVNAINFIDGLDGLAAGTSAIYFLTIAIISYITNGLTGLDSMLCLIMLGSSLGFLFHNFPPASIFMGDVGSMFLGYMIAVLALLGFKGATLTSLIIPIVILFVPIIDVFFAIIRRLLKGESIGKPDKDHLHHQMLNMKYSPKTSVLIIYLINIMFSAVSIFYVIGDTQLAILIYLILMILFLFLVLKTNILFDRNKNKKKK